MPTDTPIRAATPQDQPAIARLLERIDLRADDILAPGTCYWVAEDETGLLIGCIGMEFGQAAVLIRSVAVLPSARKHGLGRQLLEGALEFARQKGYRHAYLFSVRSGGYWQARGFRTVPVAELTAALPAAPQVLRFEQIGKLPGENAWRRDLDPPQAQGA